MTRFEPESRCAGIWPVLAHFRTVRCFTRSSSAASDAVSHSEVIATTASRMALLVDLVRGKRDSLIVHSSRMSGNPRSTALRAEFGWTCWELMRLFISGIAPCVKTQMVRRSMSRHRHARLVSVRQYYRPAQCEDGRDATGPSSTTGLIRKERREGSRLLIFLEADASNLQWASYRTTDSGLPEPDDPFRGCLTLRGDSNRWTRSASERPQDPLSHPCRGESSTGSPRPS